MKRVLGSQQRNRTRSIGMFQLEEANIVSIVRKFYSISTCAELPDIEKNNLPSINDFVIMVRKICLEKREVAYACRVWMESQDR